jgi:acyl dehydratase
MKITEDLLISFSEVSRDPNRIHLDEAVARNMGLPGVIAHGMLIAAHIEGRIRANPPREGARLKRVQFRFKAMTLRGDTLDFIQKSANEDSKAEVAALGSNGEVKAIGSGFWD